MKVIGVAVLKDLDLHLVVDNYATNKTQDPKVAGAPPLAFTCTSSPRRSPSPSSGPKTIDEILELSPLTTSGKPSASRWARR